MGIYQRFNLKISKMTSLLWVLTALFTAGFAGNAMAALISFSVTQVGTAEDFEKKDGYAFNGTLWKAPPDPDKLRATFNLTYDPASLASGFSGNFVLEYDNVPSSKYTGTINSGQTVVGVTGDFLYFQSFATDLNNATGGFSGPDVQEKDGTPFINDPLERFFEFGVELDSGTWAGLGNNILDPGADIKNMKGILGWSGFRTKNGDFAAGGEGNNDPRCQDSFRDCSLKVNASGKFPVASLAPAVPAPTSFLLFGTGLLGFWALHRRRQSKG